MSAEHGKTADIPTTYRKAYDRGWAASMHGAGEVGADGKTALERADDRGEVAAWYDGYNDHAVDGVKWATYWNDHAPDTTADNTAADNTAADNTAATPLRLVVIGPNLIDQSKGSFHVHRYGCADTLKREYAQHADDVRNGVDFGSVAEIIEYVYPSDDFGYDPATESEQYRSDLYLFPCVGDLPDTTPTTATMVPDDEPPTIQCPACTGDGLRRDRNEVMPCGDFCDGDRNEATGACREHACYECDGYGSVTDYTRTLTIPEAVLVAVERLNGARMALNTADGYFAWQGDATPYGRAETALRATLAAMVDGDQEKPEAQAFARYVYDGVLDSGESVEYVITRVLAWSLRLTRTDSWSGDVSVVRTVPGVGRPVDVLTF